MPAMPVIGGRSAALAEKAASAMSAQPDVPVNRNVLVNRILCVIALWRTHSCVPCRDSSRHLFLVARLCTSVEKSLDTERTSAYATSDQNLLQDSRGIHSDQSLHAPIIIVCQLAHVNSQQVQNRGVHVAVRHRIL